MRNEKECSNTISLENRQINESKFYDECKMRIIFLLHLKHYMRFFVKVLKKQKKLINLLIIMIKLLNLKISIM